MKNIDLSIYRHKPPTFYLAVEHYFVKNSQEDYFLTWSPCKSVIIGRNQVLHNEINKDYITKNNISLCRRFSGGGAVYADENDLMFTFILNSVEKKDIFVNCLQKICEMFKNTYHLDVEYSGRNDLLINGMKISGSSFYYYKNRVIFHGTLLYSVDLNIMTSALKPPLEKLTSKGIESVRQRVCNLSDYLHDDIKTLEKSLIATFCTETLTISEADLPKFLLYQKRLESHEWLYGKQIPSSITKDKRLDSGNYHIDILLVDHQIIDIAITGDYFQIMDISEIKRKLINNQYQKSVIFAILKKIDMSEYIYHLSTDEFIALLF